MSERLGIRFSSQGNHTAMDSEEKGAVGPLTTSSPSSSPPLKPTPVSSQPTEDGGPNTNYIIHTVSKYDTLAGVAIKYGVEVADIKRLNGLATDLQMFALKTLRIPLTGKHSPSSSSCNGHNSERPSSSEPSTSSLKRFDWFDSFQSLKLNSSSPQNTYPAMNSLQDRYGIRGADQTASEDGFEMSVYRKGRDHYLDDEHLLKSSLSSSSSTSTPLIHHMKSRTASNGFESKISSLLDPLLSQGGEKNSSGSDKWLKKLMRRRLKSNDDLTSSASEKLLKDEDNSVSSIQGKGSAPRPKAERLDLNPIPVGLGDSFVIDTSNDGVRKSSSTSSLQDPESGLLSSLWQSSNWNLKPDFQILSGSGVTRSIFDGLPKPIGRRNKKAVD